MMTKRMTLAAEVDYGCRHNVDGASRSSKRAAVMCQFSF